MATFIFEQESAGKTTGYNSGEKLEKRLLTWEPYTQAWTTSLALLACQLDTGINVVVDSRGPVTILFRDGASKTDPANVLRLGPTDHLRDLRHSSRKQTKKNTRGSHTDPHGSTPTSKGNFERRQRWEYGRRRIRVQHY